MTRLPIAARWGLVAAGALLLVTVALVASGALAGSSDAPAAGAPEPVEVESAARVPAPEAGQAKAVFEELGLT